MNIIVRMVDVAFDVYLLGLIVMAVASWAQHPIAYTIRRRLEPFYEPFLNPMRRWLRTLQAGSVQIDFSPMLLFIVTLVVREMVVSLIMRIL